MLHSFKSIFINIFYSIHFKISKQPEGIFCQGQSYREPLPQIPNIFSFTEEVIILEKRETVPAQVMNSNF